MIEVFFKISFIVLWIVYIAIRAPFANKQKGIQKIKTVNSSIEKILLTLLGIGLMLIPLVWMFTPFFDQFSLRFPNWLRMLGVVLSAGSLVYFQKIHEALGTNWSPTLEIKKDHQLVSVGPYNKVRHPMYTQIWMWTIAQVLIVSNVYASFSGIIAWAIVYLIRVPNEEKMMREQFGTEYNEYVKRTGKILPRIRLKS